MKNDPRIFLQHIQESIELIDEYTKKFARIWGGHAEREESLLHAVSR